MGLLLPPSRESSSTFVDEYQERENMASERSVEDVWSDMFFLARTPTFYSIVHVLSEPDRLKPVNSLLIPLLGP